MKTRYIKIDAGLFLALYELVQENNKNGKYSYTLAQMMTALEADNLHSSKVSEQYNK